jgi:hypothetical protein
MRNIAIGLLLLVSVGCSSGERMGVSGMVTLDGKPLAVGGISFHPHLGSAGHSAGGQIKNGEFRFVASRGLKPGRYLVSIQAFRRTGRTVVDPQMGKVPEEVLVTYNEAGKLDATVATEAPNHFDFHLTSVTGRTP